MAAYKIQQITADNLGQMEHLLDLLADVFNEPNYCSPNRPDRPYLHRLLSNPQFIALCAVEDDAIVGGLTAYELPRYEQPRSEIYICDLAVAETHRRKGIATALIQHTRTIARKRGAWVVYIQAEDGDEAPIAVYSKLGKQEKVVHFTIEP